MNKLMIEKLRQIYGSHSAVARAIGVEPRTYRRYRNAGRFPKPIRYLLEFRIAEHLGQESDLRKPRGGNGNARGRKRKA